MTLPVPKRPALTEQSIQRELVRMLGYQRVLVVPNLRYYHEMDLAALTPAGCLWEYEIKVSQHDWNRDREKDVIPEVPEWAKANPDWVKFYSVPRRRLAHVKRFYYVYAEGLTCPSWVPEWAGLISARPCPHHVELTHVRPATNRRVEKPPEKFRLAMLLSIYHRYWARG